MAEEFTGGAPAPAEPVATPAPQDGVTAPDVKVEPTPRGAIDRAFEALEKGTDQPAKPEPKPQTEADAKPAGDRPRNPDGTFAAADPNKPADPAKPDPNAEGKPAAQPETKPSDVPTRFADAQAKADWATTPQSVRGEVNRAFREMEAGIEKYRGDAQVYNDVFRPYVEMAQRSNIDPGRQLEEYVKVDMELARDFGSGIGLIFRNAGVDMRQWAQQVLGSGPTQPPDGQPQTPQDQTIADLRREIADLRNGMGGISQTVEQGKRQQIDQGVRDFRTALSAEDQKFFDEFDNEIAAEIGRGRSLADAFTATKQTVQDRYTRMFGTPAAPTPAPAAATAPPAAQTGKGTLQINGAPGPGSDPTTRRTPSSARESLDRAFADVGI